MPNRLIKFILIFISLACIRSTYAQESTIYTKYDLSFRKGLELYAKEKYNDAQRVFEQVASSMDVGASQLKSDAEFYRAMCAIELTNNDAEYLIGSSHKQLP